MDTQGVEQKKKALRLDVIIIAALLVLALVAVLVSVLMRRDGAYARIEVDGVTVATYPLSVDGEYSLNGGTNILVIKDGEAYLTYADCPDETCVATGRIRYVGQSIICLPNRVAIIIEGESEGGVDFVS